MGVNNIIGTILDIIYPQVCGICGKLAHKSLCNKCRIRLEKEFNINIDNYAEDFNKNFNEHYYFFKYENLIRQQIIALKFQEKPYVYKTIAYFFKENKKSLKKLEKYDIIIVVPVSNKRKKERGYNQSKLLAKEIAQIINVPVSDNIIKKVKDTVPQSTLNKEQRLENAKNVYRVTNIKKVLNRNILILDDIYTTGSTVNECARVLIEQGIKKDQIGLISIAKD